VTEGALVRFHARLSEASGVQLAKAILRSIEQLPHHQFWAADLPFSSLPERGLRGHKQVTDAYLVAITRARKGRLATLDEALSAWHPDACLLIR
jgi:predicted nucleic acid-binding protein